MQVLSSVIQMDVCPSQEGRRKQESSMISMVSSASHCCVVSSTKSRKQTDRDSEVAAQIHTDD